MTPLEMRLVAALLRCSVESSMHAVSRELAIGRLNNEVWAAYYAHHGNAFAAAAAIEAQIERDERDECEAADAFARTQPVEFGLAELRDAEAATAPRRLFDLSDIEPSEGG